MVEHFTKISEQFLEILNAIANQDPEETDNEELIRNALKPIEYRSLGASDKNSQETLKL